MHEVAEGVDALEQCVHQRDEDDEAPAGAKAVCAEEDPTKSGGLCGGHLIGGRYCFAVARREVFVKFVQGMFLMCLKRIRR
jgi:hypothetical protein